MTKFYVMAGIHKDVKVTVVSFFRATSIVPKEPLRRRFRVHAFFYKQHFYKQRQPEICKKTTKKQANVKQHPEAELLLFENYSHSSSTLSFKNNSAYCIF